MIKTAAHLTLTQFSAFFQCFGSLPHFLLGEKYLRQLKQKEDMSHSVKNMFIKDTLFFSFG